MGHRDGCRRSFWILGVIDRMRTDIYYRNVDVDYGQCFDAVVSFLCILFD
jgi:cephalosporin-C deacetylase-like acetyl esterase